MTGAEPLRSFLSLDGRVALVAGGGGGIGRATVRRLLEAGATVVSVDQPGVGAVSGAESVECDVGELESVNGVFGDLESRFGGIDLLVHCAGITRDGMLWKLEASDWAEVVRTNLDSAFFLLKGAALSMRRKGRGAIVLVSSINGQRGKAGQANYAASKAGLIGLARTAARELGPRGIRVNVIAPGLVETGMTAGLPEEVRLVAIGESALGRAGSPDDVARAILFLATDASRHVTGQVLRVDGGQFIG